MYVCLFNDLSIVQSTTKVYHHTAINDKTIDELEGYRRKLKALSWHLPGWTEENH